MKKYLVTLVFLLLCKSVFAAPAIDSVAGTIVDGGEIVISSTATNFGTNTMVGTSALQILETDIEAGTEGNVFSEPSGWANFVDIESTTEATARYDDAQAHNGSQSLTIDFDKTDALNTKKLQQGPKDSFDNLRLEC